MGRPDKNVLVWTQAREGQADWNFDFGKLGLSFKFAHALRRATEAVFGHTEIVSKYKVAIVLRRFARFLFAANMHVRSRLPADCFQKYAKWLADSELGPSAQAHVVIVKNLLQWCVRNAPGVLQDGANLVAPLIRPTKRKTASRGLTEAELKAVLQACYDEIERTEQRIWKMRSLLSGKWQTSEELEYLLVVRDIAAVAKIGRFASQKQLVNHGLVTRVRKAGGLRRIEDAIHMMPRDVHPFYLAILAQVSGNAESILALDVDCIRPHPIRDDLVRVIWYKPRARSQQFAEFPVGKAWHAPDLIVRLRALTSSLRMRVPVNKQNKLFLRHSLRSGACAVTLNELRDELAKFTKAHSLRPFQFHDLRGTGGQIANRVRNSDLDAQRRLNHKSPATTQLYIRTEDSAADDNRRIHFHQATLARLAQRREPSPQPAEQKAVLHAKATAAETVFGFSCKDPLSGIAPGSTKGSPCLQFLKCAGCPGAFVVLDDWNVVARLLAASNALNQGKARAQTEGWWKRYSELYEPTRVILDEVLLTTVSPVILARAREVAATLPTPYLE